MEDIHNFEKGLHTEFNPQNQPSNSYREAYNWVRLEDGSLITEKGTRRILTFPIENAVVYMHPLGEEIIVFSYGIDTDFQQYGEIGVVDKFNNYSTSTSHKSLDFLNKNIKAEARVDYRGHRLVYFWDINGELPARKIDLDGTYTSNIEEETRLFLVSKQPIIKATSITEDGNLPTGIYQFSVRLLTSSLNKSTTSLLTDIVPITNETISGGTEAYDGALPQTPSFKSINLEVSNIDTKYKFIQIIATTYESLTNTIKSNVIATKPITGETMTHKYSSLEDNEEEVLLDELTIEPLNLDYPKAGTQKDGHLLLSNLRAESYDYNFQYIANKTTIEYVIKELDYTENININSAYSTNNTGGGIDIGTPTSEFDNYKSELYTTDFRGYQRDEVYSFALVPIFKNGSYGNAYHIPGNYLEFTNDNPGDTGANPADTNTKKLGYFKCLDELYPEGYGYPLGQVTYHMMPSMEQEPIYANGKIRVLGIKVNYDLSSLTSEEQSNIVGIAIVRELRTENNKTILAQGIVNPLADDLNDSTHKIVIPFGGKPHYSTSIVNPDGGILYNSVAFYSPETTILRNNLITATHIKPVAIMSGNSFVAGKYFPTTTTEEDQAYAHFFLNYNSYNSNLSGSSYHGSVEIDRNSLGYVGNGDKYSNPDISYTIDIKENNGFFHIETLQDIPVFNNNTTKDRILYNGNQVSEITVSANEIYLQSGGSVIASSTSGAGECSRNLFNVVASLTNPYGEVMNKEYVLVDYKLLDESSSIICYGGDTFINKTSLVSTTRTTKVDGKGLWAKHRTLSYFFCESTVNTAYRHVITTDGVFTTVPYYPKSRAIFNPEQNGILNFEPRYGHANGYNKQYSFENTLKKFYSKSQFIEENVTRFANRAIYSEKSIEGEQFDSYRLFLTNNYHDVPKNKGEITNLFVHQNDLYIHTSQSLWKSSFNERVTQISSAGEVVLGNGGAFSRPSLEMFPHAGGYAGSIDSLATISTPYGTFFVDRLQKKIFLLGSSFDEVSSGIRRELIEKLTDASGCISTFDYLNDRLLIHGKESFTLSYFPKLKSFTSYHNYFPASMTSVNQKTFIADSKLYELNVGDYGLYSEEIGIQPSTITIVSNDNPLSSKTYDSLVINSNLPFTNLEVSDEDKTITKELVSNDDWEFEPTSTQSRITKKNSEYRLSIPLDEDERRIKGKYSTLKLDYSNLSNLEFIVKYIKINYRINAR